MRSGGVYAVLGWLDGVSSPFNTRVICLLTCFSEVFLGVDSACSNLEDRFPAQRGSAFRRPARRTG